MQRSFGRAPAEIFVNPPDRVGPYFENDKRDGRLMAAHMVATGFAVYQEGSPRRLSPLRLARSGANQTAGADGFFEWESEVEGLDG